MHARQKIVPLFLRQPAILDGLEAEAHQQGWNDPEQGDNRRKGWVKAEDRERGHAGVIGPGEVFAQAERGRPAQQPNPGWKENEAQIEAPLVGRAEDGVDEQQSKQHVEPGEPMPGPGEGHHEQPQQATDNDEEGFDHISANRSADGHPV